MAVVSPPREFNAATFFVDRHAGEARAGRTAFRYRGRSISYAEVVEAQNRAGNALAGLGLEVDNRVLIALTDSPDFAAAFWGAVKLGAIAVPVNTLMTADDYEFVLRDSRAKVAVVDERIAPAIVSVRDRCPYLRAIVSTGRAPAGSLSLDGLMARQNASLSAGPTSRDDVMYWGYTSGSTGEPKAATHTHADFVAAADLVGLGVFGISEDDVLFSASKMFFAFGLGNSLYFPARVGASSVLVPERMDEERAFDTIALERATVFFAVATLYARMLQVPDAERRWDLSSLRLCVSSGEALPAAVFDAWGSRFGLELTDVVGSTEALHDFLANRPGKARRGSCGQVVPGFAARLVDDDGREVPTGEVGHLLIKGPTTSLGYWNRPERTRTTMLGEWLRTGDMMRRDEDDYFCFAGRSDDMLKVGGLWVSPAEIEAALAEHPAVVEAGVVGRVNTTGLTRSHACVVVREGVTASADLAAELRTFLRSRLAGYKVPDTIDFVGELPKTATGKIQRFRLRARS